MSHSKKDVALAEVVEFARSIGMNATLLRNYINGFKKPSAEIEKAILAPGCTYTRPIDILDT